jgi:hypothetical protein
MKFVVGAIFINPNIIIQIINTINISILPKYFMNGMLRDLTNEILTMNESN